MWIRRVLEKNRRRADAKLAEGRVYPSQLKMSGHDEALLVQMR
jgi:hypothetical protein